MRELKIALFKTNNNYPYRFDKWCYSNNFARLFCSHKSRLSLDNAWDSSRDTCWPFHFLQCECLDSRQVRQFVSNWQYWRSINFDFSPHAHRRGECESGRSARFLPFGSFDRWQGQSPAMNNDENNDHHCCCQTTFFLFEIWWWCQIKIKCLFSSWWLHHKRQCFEN